MCIVWHDSKMRSISDFSIFLPVCCHSFIVAPLTEACAKPRKVTGMKCSGSSPVDFYSRWILASRYRANRIRARGKNIYDIREHHLDKSITAAKRSLQVRFNVMNDPYTNTNKQLYEKFIQTGSFAGDVASNFGRYFSGITASNMDTIKSVITRSPKKSVRKLAVSFLVRKNSNKQNIAKVVWNVECRRVKAYSKYSLSDIISCFKRSVKLEYTICEVANEVASHVWLIICSSLVIIQCTTFFKWPYRNKSDWQRSSENSANPSLLVAFR